MLGSAYNKFDDEREYTIMNSILRTFLVSGFILAFSLQAQANAPAPVHSEFMNQQEQITLTNDAVEKVVKVLPKLIALTKNYTTAGHSAAPSQKPVKNKKYEAFTTALETLSGQHGFKDSKIMQRTVETTMLTAGFLKSGKTLKQVDAQILATQKTVETNPKLDAKQKSSLLRRMHIQVSMVVPTAENLKTVKPFFPRIIAITGKK